MQTKIDERKPKSGADIVVQTLQQRGVEYVFGVPGAKIDKVFDTLVDSKIKTAESEFDMCIGRTWVLNGFRSAAACMDAGWGTYP